MIVIKGLLSWHLRGAGSVSENQITRRNFGIVCGIEFGAGGLDALLLNLTNRPHLVAPWILLVVGAHFVWLAEILRDPGLQVLALLMVAGAVLAVIWPGLGQDRLTGERRPTRSRRCMHDLSYPEGGVRTAAMCGHP